MLRRTRILLPMVALLALPASALAASVSVSGKAVAVSPTGTAQVEVKNPTGRALRGTASVVTGTTTLATRSVRLPERSTTRVALRFDAEGLAGVRAAGGGRVTVKLALRRAGGRRTTVTRKVTLTLPAAPPAPAPGGASGGLGAHAPASTSAPAPAPAPTPAPAPAPAPAPPPVSWTARIGDTTIGLELRDGQFTLTDTLWMPVTCTETNGAGRTRTMRDRFVVRGPWSASGDSAPVERSSVSINDLVGTAFRPMSFSVTGATLQPGRLAATLHIAFTGRPWTGAGYTDVSCAGSQPFEAVPAA